MQRITWFNMTNSNELIVIRLYIWNTILIRLHLILFLCHTLSTHYFMKRFIYKTGEIWRVLFLVYLWIFKIRCSPSYVYKVVNIDVWCREMNAYYCIYPPRHASVHCLLVPQLLSPSKMLRKDLHFSTTQILVTIWDRCR